MKGKIEGIEYWSDDDICYYLSEAGLRKIQNRTHLYKCEVADVTEVIAAIEACHEVAFSLSDYKRLAKLMARGSIGKCAFRNWLMKCNEKPVRKAKTHAMPLLEGGAK